jgi:hypothetical protein
MKKISRGKIMLFQVPLPELAEQRDIRKTLRRIAAARDLAASAVKRLADLRDRLLHDLLSGEHEIPDSYDRFIEAS